MSDAPTLTVRIEKTADAMGVCYAWTLHRGDTLIAAGVCDSDAATSS